MLRLRPCRGVSAAGSGANGGEGVGRGGGGEVSEWVSVVVSGWMGVNEGGSG